MRGAAGVEAFRFQGEGAKQAVKERYRTMKRDKDELKPWARELCDRAAARLLRESMGEAGHIPRPDGMAELLVLGGNSASTLNQYAGEIHRWQVYATQWGMKDFPVDAYAMATWLVSTALNDSTASPTMNRIAAVCWGDSKVGGKPSGSLSGHPLIVATRLGLRRKLGLRQEQRKAMMPTHLHQMYLRFAKENDAPLQDIQTMTQLALAMEGALRADDLASVAIGSIILSGSVLQVFVAGSKTDRYKDGQWATVALSDVAESASQLVSRYAVILRRTWAGLPVEARAKIIEQSADDAQAVDPRNESQFLDYVSLMGKLEVVDILEKGEQTVAERKVLFPRLGFSGLIKTSELSARLKKWAHEVGIENANDFASHSLKIGGIQTAAAFGIPDRLVQTMGRWRSPSMVGHYIGAERSVRELSGWLQKLWPRESQVTDTVRAERLDGEMAQLEV